MSQKLREVTDQKVFDEDHPQNQPFQSFHLPPAEMQTESVLD